MPKIPPVPPKGVIPPQLIPTLFQPGKSGNPGGKPKSPTLELLIRERCNADPTLMGKLFDAILREAVAGSAPHAKILVERAGGIVGANVYDREAASEGADASPRTIIRTDEDDEDNEPSPDLPEL